MTEENKDSKESSNKRSNKKSNKQTVLVIACVLFIAALFVGFQNCGKNKGFSGSASCGGGVCKETFDIKGIDTKRVADVLFVVDHSGSMPFRQGQISQYGRMSQRFSSFLDHMAGIDFQIGILTASYLTQAFRDDTTFQSLLHPLEVMDGKLLSFDDSGTKFLTPDDDNLESKFRAVIEELGENSTSLDSFPFKNVTLAIEQRDEYNQGFFRDGADLVIIVVSDVDPFHLSREDYQRRNLDQGNHYGEEEGIQDSSYRKGEFLTKVAEVWPDKQVVVHGLTIPSREAFKECSDDQTLFAKEPVVITEAVTVTGGIIGNLCANDYGPILSGIGQSIASDIVLTLIPDLAKRIIVTLQTEDGDIELEPQDFTVNGNRLSINIDIDPGTKVKVEYEYKP